jgi:hypothetical protein
MYFQNFCATETFEGRFDAVPIRIGHVVPSISRILTGVGKVVGLRLTCRLER